MIILRFVHGTSFFDKCIQQFTWGYWNHVELWTPAGYFGAQPEGGVQCRPFGYDTGKFSDEAFRCIELCPRDQSRFWVWTYAQKGKPYDWTGIFGLVARRDWKEPDSWFCSELIAAAFDAIGCPVVNPFQNQHYKITPRDLGLLPTFKDCPKP